MHAFLLSLHLVSLEAHSKQRTTLIQVEGETQSEMPFFDEVLTGNMEPEASFAPTIFTIGKSHRIRSLVSGRVFETI